MNRSRIFTLSLMGLFAFAATAGMLQAADPAAAATTGANGAASASPKDLAAQATNPAAPLIQLQMQNLSIFETNGSSDYANQFILQPVIPISKMGKLPRSIFRPTIPMVTSADITNGPKGRTGLGDISWVYIYALDQDWGVFGVGPAGAIPTATDPLLGARKWTLGPSVFAMYTKIPKVQIGALVSNTWDVGGSGSSGVDKMSVQLIANYHFGEGWYTGWGDQALNFNWHTDNNKTYFPISWRLGRVFSMGKQKVNCFVQPHYNVGDDIIGQDQWGLKFNMTLLFPEG